MTILHRITALLALTVLTLPLAACDLEPLDEADDLDLTAEARGPVARPGITESEAAPDGCDPQDPDACAPGYTCTWVHVEPDGAFFCVFDGDSNNDDEVSLP